eukprot:Pgem_evm1s16175
MMGGEMQVDLGQVIFNRHDVDRTGKLSLKQFKEVCYDLNYELSEQEIELGMQYLDRDGDKNLDLKEFKRWWGKGQSREKRLHLKEEQLQARVIASNCFFAFDHDDSGTIEKEEFTLFFLHLKRKEIIEKNKDKDELFEELDPEGTGKISFYAYIDWLEDNKKQSPEVPSTQSTEWLINESKPKPQPQLQVETPKTEKRMSSANSFPYPTDLHVRCTELLKNREKTISTAWKNRQTTLDKLLKQQSSDEQAQGRVHDKKVTDLERELNKKEVEKMKLFSKDQNMRKKELKKAKLPMDEATIQKEYNDEQSKIQEANSVEIDKLKMFNLKQYFTLLSNQIKERNVADLDNYKEYVALDIRLLSEEQEELRQSIKRDHAQIIKTETKQIDKKCKAAKKQRKKEKNIMSPEELAKMHGTLVGEIQSKLSEEMENFEKKCKQQKEQLENSTNERIKNLVNYYNNKLVENEEKMQAELDTYVI